MNNNKFNDNAANDVNNNKQRRETQSFHSFSHPGKGSSEGSLPSSMYYVYVCIMIGEGEESIDPFGFYYCPITVHAAVAVESREKIFSCCSSKVTAWFVLFLHASDYLRMYALHWA